MLDKKLNRIQRAAAVLGLAVPPSNLVPDLCVLDPVAFPFSISAGALAGDNALTNLTPDEIVPYGIADTGVLKSAGSGQAFVGFIYGVSAVLGPCTAADADVLGRGLQIVIKCGNQTRTIPLCEAVRYNPGRAVANTNTATAIDVATGCPTGPGKPQYMFPGQAMPWTARKGDDVVGLSDAYAAGTTGATVKGLLLVYLVAAPGEGEDVSQGSVPRIACDRAPDTAGGFAATIQNVANFAKMLRR